MRSLQENLLCAVLCGLAVVLHADEVRNSFGSQSQFDPKTRTLSKTNCVGVTIWRSACVPVKNGQIYSGTLKLDVLARTPGALASLELVYLNEDGRPVGGVQESSGAYQILYGAQNTWQLKRLSVANHKAKAMRLDLKLAGNPSSVRIDAFEISPYAETPLFAGVYTAKQPYPDLAAELEKMKAIPPASGTIQSRNGHPVAVIDGREVACKSYKGSIDYGPLCQAGGNLLITFNSGTTLFWSKMSWDLSTLQSDGTFDFSRLERELALIHAQAPAARVLLNFDLDVGEDFFRQHPDSIFRNEKGELGVRQFCAFDGFGVPGPNPAKNRHWAVSYASEDYAAYVERGLRATVAFLKGSPAGNIVAGFTFNGGHDAQFLQWEYSAYRGQADYSPAATKAFRRYLREKYKTDSMLQKAWQDPAVTLDTARNFTEAEWQSRPCHLDAQDGVERKIADGREFISISIARLQNRWARLLHDSWPRPCIVGTYYSSPLWGQTGRSNFLELIKDGNINAIFQVSDYSTMRRPGGIGASANFTIGSTMLHDVLYVQEMDHRSPRSQITGNWAAEPATNKDFQNQIFRDAGSVLSHGGNGFFYFDMYDSWYNDPAVLKSIAATYRAADWQNRYRDEVPRTRTAVFLDERAIFFASVPGGGRLYEIWRMSGLTPDVYLLDDIRDPHLPDYQLYIVPGAYTLNALQIAALKEKACRPGKVLFLTGSPGSLSGVPQAGLCRPVLAQFGMAVNDCPQAINDRSEFLPDSDDPLAKNCTGLLGLGSSVIETGNQVTHTRYPFYSYIDDPTAKILARWCNSAFPSLAVKRSDASGTLIYSAQVDGATPQLLCNAAREAGIQPCALPGNNVTVGCGVAAVYRLADPVTLNFSENMEFFDAEDGAKIGEGRTLAVPCAPWESRLILYRKASSTPN